jgi:hypothetical protein
MRNALVLLVPVGAEKIVALYLMPYPFGGRIPQIVAPFSRTRRRYSFEE